MLIAPNELLTKKPQMSNYPHKLFREQFATKIKLENTSDVIAFSPLHALSAKSSDALFIIHKELFTPSI